MKEEERMKSGRISAEDSGQDDHIESYQSQAKHQMME